MKLSIVMSYFNREELLLRTLETIRASKIKPYEIIIVDDGSSDPLSCRQAKVIRIDKQNKWWHNPCVPFNIGFAEATGDVVIIQNPECMYRGDVLQYVVDNIHDGLYLSFGCYAINEQETNKLRENVTPCVYDRPFSGADKNGWYNHTTHRPMAYHFCSAIMKKDLDRMGGFDPRYADGISYDDDDFVYRIHNANMEIKIVDAPFVIHQWHYPFTYRQENVNELHEKNKKLFTSIWL